MSLEIIRIPEIIEYGTNFSSRWKCAWLPILWEIQSDLFPTNSVDVALIITSVADNGEGLAEFTCTANHLLSRFDWVNVTSSTVADYEGIEQIVEVSAGNIFTLNIPFNGTATGSAIKYYNNYHALIEVYGGLPSGHEFEAQDPSLLTTTVKIFFDSNNIAVVDLSRIAQTLINNIFSPDIISFPNVLNFWNQTEILLKESFDQSNGVLVTTNERYGCIKDGGFVTGADWSNEGTGATWTFGSDQANVSLDEAGDNDSKELTQTILGDALARFSITVTFTFTHTSGTPSVRLRAVIGGTTINVQGSTTSQATLTKTVTGLTANDLGVFSLEADITAGSGTDTADIVLDDVEVCIGLANEVVNSKLDFRNGRGGNMFDYIIRPTAELSKWMTGFIRPTLFRDEYFSLSAIFDGIDFNNTLIEIVQKDGNGDRVGDTITESIDDQDIGIYQLRIDQLGLRPATKTIEVTIIDQNPTTQWTEIITNTILDLYAVAVHTDAKFFIGGEAASENDVNVVLQKTDNRGSTWTDKPVPNDSSRVGVSAIFSIPNTANKSLMVAKRRTGTGIISFGVSTDELDTYGTVSSAGQSAQGPIRISVPIASTIWVIVNNAPVKRSVNFGASFANVANNLPATGRDIAGAFGTTSLAWAITTGNRIYNTPDAAATAWVLQDTAAQSLNAIFAVSTTIVIAVGNNGLIRRTTDGGTIWVTIAAGLTNENLNDVYICLDGNGNDALTGWISGANGTILSTPDAGATWVLDTVPASFSTVNLRSIHGLVTIGRATAVAVGDGGKALLKTVKDRTETKILDFDQNCSSQDIYLMWLNQFGGWDFWKFTAEKDFNTDITESQRTEKNIYDDWPKSYNRQSLREESRISGFKSITVRSQHLTAAQADSIGGIKISMYVLEIKEGLFLSDNVTVLVDKNSFQRFNETDDLFTMVFNIRQTDDIATQSN